LIEYLALIKIPGFFVRGFRLLARGGGIARNSAEIGRLFIT
jgi:hypothetical protein